MNSKTKNALIGGLLAIVFVMAVGYAAFAQQLTINGTASISSNWNVYIDSIDCSVQVSSTDSESVSTSCGNYGVGDSNTTANFEATLISPGDIVVYTVTVKNGGTINAKLADITLSVGSAQNDLTVQTDLTAAGSNDAIVYTVQDLTVGETLLATDSFNTKTFTVTVTYNSTTGEQPETAELTQYAELKLDYEQATD